MKIMTRKSAAAAIAVSLILAGYSPAEAATMIKYYDFEAQTDGPIKAHKGSFSLAYDDVTQIYTLKSINFSIGSFVYTLANTQAGGWSGGFAVFGARQGQGVEIRTNDFWLGSVRLSSTRETTRFLYTAPGFGANGFASNSGPGSVILREVAAPVPEPKTWAMMILGLLGIGWALRNARRHHSVKPSTTLADIFGSCVATFYGSKDMSAAEAG